jgi:predicted RNA-binding protein with PUA domain
MYFEPNYRRWAPSVIYKGIEATALSSKSIRVHLGNLNAVENVKILVCFFVEFCKTARSSFFVVSC